MILFIFDLTLGQILRMRSSLILLGLAAIPLLVAGVFRAAGSDISPDRWTANTLFGGLVVTAVLPLTTLLIGASVIGDEIEEGTAVYLLTKPVARWRILLPKLMAASLVGTDLVLVSALASGFIALEGQGDYAILTGFCLAVAASSMAYTTVFVLISLITSRALIAGLVYVFVWEATVTTLFAGTRYFSIRHYTLGLADWVAGTPDGTFNAYIDGVLSAVLIALTTVAAAIIASQRFKEVEVRESA